MHLLSAELNGSVALRHALQAAIVATAAVAGYVTVLPLASQFHQADEIVAEQPVWAGHIERRIWTRRNRRRPSPRPLISCRSRCLAAPC